MRRTRPAAISFASALVIASIVAGIALVPGPGVAVAAPTGATYAVGQGGQCVAEVAPLGNASQSSVEYYDYRAGGEQYASHGTTDVQASGVSQIYAYNGSDGTSLVFLHDRLGDRAGGGAVSFNVSGLPTDGDWTVEDDDYPGQDDVFVHSGAESELHWMWSPNRTDGAVFRGLRADGWTEITVDPAFGESSYAGRDGWTWADDGPTAWRVRDRDGTTTTLEMDAPVSIRAGGCSAVSPTVSLSAPGNATTDEPVTLNASAAESPTTPIEYRWDVDGDGTVEATTANASLEHTYSTTGEVHASVTAMDRFGRTADASATVTVEGDAPPTAVASVPDAATVGENVTVDASGSSDDGEITSHEWAFGDGSTATGVTATHAYGAAGNYTVTLTVTDDNGTTDTATGAIEVTEGNQPPTAAFEWRPADPAVNESVRFDGSAASDPEGAIATYEWDVDGDGSTDAFGLDTSHTFATAGDHNVTLTVTDGDGATDATSNLVNVSAGNSTADGSENAPPSVSLAANRTAVTEGNAIALSATASDPDGDALDTAWTQVSGPADLDLPDGTNGTVTPAENGTYEVRVTVEDPDGATTADAVTLEVAEPDTAPEAAFDWSPSAPEPGETVTLDASAATDPDGPDASYRWDLDDDGSFEANGSTATHVFGAAGTYDVRLRVTDDGGAVDTAVETVSVAATDDGGSGDGGGGSGGDTGGSGGGGGGSSGGSSGGPVASASTAPTVVTGSDATVPAAENGTADNGTATNGTASATNATATNETVAGGTVDDTGTPATTTASEPGAPETADVATASMLEDTPSGAETTTRTTGTRSASPGQPGFGAGLAVLALLGAVRLARSRR